MTPEEKAFFETYEYEGLEYVLREMTAGSMPTPKLRGLHAQLHPLLKQMDTELNRIEREYAKELKEVKQ